MTKPAGFPSQRRRGALLWSAAAATVLLWASAFVGIRVAGTEFEAGTLTLGRVIVGTITLALLSQMLRPRDLPGHARGPAWRAFRRSPKRVQAGVIAWGVAWFCIYNLALNAAEHHVDAGTAAVLVNLAPIITAVLAGLWLNEGFPPRLLAGMGTALAGVLIVGISTSTGRLDAIGVALCLAAAIIYGASAMLQKRLLRHIDAPTMTLVGCASGAVACMPFAPALIAEVGRASPLSVLTVIYLGIFPTGIAFTTWGYVLARMSAGRTAAMTYAVPALAVMLSWITLRETPPVFALLGGALALVGVAIATSGRRGGRLRATQDGKWPQPNGAEHQDG